MKKHFLLLPLFVALAATSWAQTTFSLVTPACHNDGVLSASFGGLTPPLTVTWTTYGSTGSSIIHTGVTGLSDILTSYSGGPVSVSAVGAGGLHDSGTYAAPPFYYSDSLAPAICPSLGADHITLSGGTAPFTYYWYNIATTGAAGTTNPISLAPGDYGVVITDGRGCVYGSTVDPHYIHIFNVAPFYDSIYTTVANCTNGTAIAAPVGTGIPPYSYLWSNGATTPVIGGLVMGFYSVKITDGNGCSDSAGFEITQAVTISSPITTTPATCVASDGAVIAFGSGGHNPYTYSWSNGATTQSQTGLPAGIYNVTVTDALGCIGYGTTYVGATTPITATYTTTPSLCTTPDGTATLALSGGTGGYSVEWITSPPQTSITATNLTYGTYDFHVTDAVGCVQSGTVYVPPIDVISVSFTSVPALCTLANGSMMALPTGGAAPYHYLWSTGATTAGITAAPAGFYGLRITDNLGCIVNKEPYLPVTSPLNAGIFTTPASCIFTNDGKDSANAWGGTPPYAYYWSNGGATRTITGLAKGPYWLFVSDSLGCTAGEYYSYVGYDTGNTSCYCTINGTVFTDYNSNCLQDAGEPGIPNIQIHISGRGYTYTDATGHYSYKVPVGSYTVSEKVLDFYPLAGCQSNDVSVSAAGGGCSLTVNFANNLDTIHDMHISTWNYLNNEPVIGHSFTQAVIVSNDGTVNEDSILVSFKPDGQIFAPSFVPGGYFSGSPYYYRTDSFTTLAAGGHKMFLLTYSVPTNIPLGTTLVFKDSVAYKGPMTNWLNDYSPWNNVKYFTDTTVGSFDPNFKEVSPQGTGPEGTISYTDSVLEYMVHFQNTGTYMAENIKVIDTLDDNLDWSSLRPVFESANCNVTLTQMGTKNVAEFDFNNINLPDSATDRIRSNGMFTYTVHLKRGLAVGTHIRNHASIYFDYNKPVVTNSTINTIGTSDPHVGVKNIELANNSFTIYPNPVATSFSAIITSATMGKATISVSDITGKVLLTKAVTVVKGMQTIPVDISQAAPGTYLVNYAQNGKMQTQKLVIIR